MIKNIICSLTLLLCCVLLFCACEKIGDSPLNESVNNETSSLPTVSDNSSEIVNNESNIVSKPPESEVILSPSTPEIPELITVKVGPYEIYDALNSRGLSTKKSGFGYGVAKDGKPHSISVNNQKRFDSINNVEALALDTKSNEKCMYLTFDCGYEYKNFTSTILDTLKDKNVKAAFFVTGDYLKKNQTLVQRMIDEGHIVGNHSYSHPSFPNISREKMANEIWMVEDYLKTNFNYTSKYFRFPEGAHSENSLELVSSMGYKSIFWSLAHADWDTANQPTTQSAVNTVTSRFHDGAVILLHTVSQANMEGLSDMIDIAIQQGYTFKPLDDYYT